MSGQDPSPVQPASPGRGRLIINDAAARSSHGNIAPSHLEDGGQQRGDIRYTRTVTTGPFINQAGISLLSPRPQGDLINYATVLSVTRDT